MKYSVFLLNRQIVTCGVQVEVIVASTYMASGVQVEGHATGILVTSDVRALAHATDKTFAHATGKHLCSSAWNPSSKRDFRYLVGLWLKNK